MSCPRSTAWISPSDSEPISSFLSLIHLRRSTGRTAEGVAAAAPFVVSGGDFAIARTIPCARSILRFLG